MANTLTNLYTSQLMDCFLRIYVLYNIYLLVSYFIICFWAKTTNVLNLSLHLYVWCHICPIKLTQFCCIQHCYFHAFNKINSLKNHISIYFSPASKTVQGIGMERPSQLNIEIILKQNASHFSFSQRPLQFHFAAYLHT